MLFSRALGLVILAVTLPIVGSAQTLNVEIGAGTAHMHPKPDIICSNGTEGFELTQRTVSADLQATSEFASVGTGRPRVRRGLTNQNSSKHFRPAVRTIESRKTIIDVARGQIRNEGSKNLRAKAQLTLTGCRSGNALQIVSGHLKLIGVVAAHGVHIDASLKDLIGAKALAGGSDLGKQPTSNRDTDGVAKGLTYSMRDMSFREEALKFMSVEFEIDKWKFRAIESDGPELSGRVIVSWSSVVAEQPRPIKRTN